MNSEKGSLLFRPGTIFLFVMIVVLGFGMYTWANTSIGETREKSLENKNNAIACSNLEISLSDMKISSNRTVVYFQSNKALEQVNLNFQGEKNVSKTVGPVENRKIKEVGANISDFSKVSLKTPDCDRVFHFE